MRTYIEPFEFLTTEDATVTEIRIVDDSLIVIGHDICVDDYEGVDQPFSGEIEAFRLVFRGVQKSRRRVSQFELQPFRKTGEVEIVDPIATNPRSEANLYELGGFLADPRGHILDWTIHARSAELHALEPSDPDYKRAIVGRGDMIGEDKWYEANKDR